VPDHAGPTAQAQQRGGHKIILLVSAHAEQFERFGDGSKRVTPAVLDACQLRRQAMGPRPRWAARLAVQIAKGFEETQLASRQRPTGKPLIGERRAEAAQQFVHQRVTIYGGGLQQQVAMPQRHAAWGRGRRDGLHALQANRPQRLQ